MIEIKPINDDKQKSLNKSLFNNDLNVEVWLETLRRNDIQSEIEAGVRYGSTKLTNQEIKQGFKYNLNGEIVMSPETVKLKGYSFIITSDGKITLVDKNYNILMNDVDGQQGQLKEWITKNNIWNKPKTLTEAGSFERIRNPKGYAEIHEAFESAGNFTAAVAAGIIASPILLEGAATFAPQALKLINYAAQHATLIAKQVANYLGPIKLQIINYARTKGIDATQWIKGLSNWDKFQFGMDAVSQLDLIPIGDGETRRRIASGLSVLNAISNLFPSKYKRWHLLLSFPDASYDIKDSLSDMTDIPNWIHTGLDLGTLLTINKYHFDDIFAITSNIDDAYAAITGKDAIRDMGKAIGKGAKDTKRIIDGLQITQDAKDEVEKQILNFNVNHYANGGLIRKIK